ncbi:hypothetical protein ABB34_09355 [Stenotrophomonas daejeonensis]|uniref:Gas vesicle protein n=1 Tax=Stenotrophomonas daejeonensis TaxID=659018 RepID=A0A0R0E2R4_9GAMM|nr:MULTISPECIES: hypothetical protein [Stenotrophomonas]KRG84382.1 hypothetical protein ABB34_09355 [Stenotrophomonas daejeonensis]MCG8276869.1 hypothetical protein [Stenotrophomonas sp. NLF4-10]
MSDPVLEVVIKLAENSPEIDIPVTLTVGGLLISGRVISRENYMQENWLTASIEEGIKQALAQIGEDPKPADGHRHYIHLRDVRYFSPGQSPTPSVGTVTCRIALAHVSAFHFGFLSLAEG